MAELRRRILDAAIDLIVENGLEAISFREAARRAGVSHQAPYHLFGNREGILAALAEEGFVGLNHVLEQKTVADPIESLREMGRAYVSFALTYPAHYELMFHPRWRALDHVPGLQTAEQATRGRIEVAVQNLRESGIALDQDPAEIVTLIWSTLHGAVTLAQAGPLSRSSDPGTQQRIAEGAVNALTDLVIQAYT